MDCAGKLGSDSIMDRKMTSGRLIIKNTAALTVGKGLGDLFTFFFLVYFARVFGMDILGKYAFGMSIGGFITLFVTFGLNSLMVREVSKDKGRNTQYMTNLLVTQGVLACIVWIMIVLVAWILPVHSDTKLIVIIIGTYHMFYKMTMLFRSEFRAHEEMHYSAFLEIFHKIIILVLGLGSIMIWKDPVITLSVYPVSAFLMFVLGFWLSVIKYGWPNAKIEFAFIREIFGRSFPFLIILILGEFYSRIGIILLAFIQGESATGVYAAADRLLVTVATGVYTFGAALLPTMSRLSVSATDELYKIFSRSIRLMIVGVLPVCTLLYIASGPIILLLYGGPFSDSIVVLSIRAWSLLFVGLNVILSGLLIVKNKQNSWVKIQAITCLAYGVGCLVLIPSFSYVGLAYTKLAADVLLFLIAYSYIQKTIYGVRIVRMGWGPVLSCFLAVFVFYLMVRFSVWIAIPTAMTVCVASMFLFKGVQIHDLRFIKDKLLSPENPLVEGRIVSE